MIAAAVVTQSAPARPQAATPAAEAAELQRRLRRLTPLLRRGEDYHVELDAIASRLGELAMRLEGYEPAGRTWRSAPRRT